MPLYEYLCRKCSNEFTLLQQVSVGEGETVCPKCGTDNIKRLFSTFSSNGEKEADSFSAGNPGGGHGCGSGGCGCA